MALTDGGEKVVGKLYLEFYDQELNISEEIPRKRIGKDKVAKISSAMAEIRKRYGQKESIHEYMSKVQSAVQEGLVELAKNRSCNPLKRLGEFLLSYDRNGRSTGSQLESVKS